MKTWQDLMNQVIIKTAYLIERLIFKITSGRFIFTVIVAAVYAYMAVNGMLKEDRINEITLIVLYAYFNRPRPETNGDNNGNGDS